MPYTHEGDWRGILKVIYPSKSFRASLKQAFVTRTFLEISIDGGWRGKILAKEVDLWLPVNEIGLVEKGPWRSPSNWCGMLMMSLYAAHYMAISADYELTVLKKGDHITLRYMPLEKKHV